MVTKVTERGRSSDVVVGAGRRVLAAHCSKRLEPLRPDSRIAKVELHRQGKHPTQAIDVFLFAKGKEGFLDHQLERGGLRDPISEQLADLQATLECPGERVDCKKGKVLRHRIGQPPRPEPGGDLGVRAGRQRADAPAPTIDMPNKVKQTRTDCRVVGSPAERLENIGWCASPVFRGRALSVPSGTDGTVRVTGLVWPGVECERGDEKRPDPAIGIHGRRSAIAIAIASRENGRKRKG